MNLYHALTPLYPKSPVGGNRSRAQPHLQQLRQHQCGVAALVPLLALGELRAEDVHEDAAVVLDVVRLEAPHGGAERAPVHQRVQRAAQHCGVGGDRVSVHCSWGRVHCSSAPYAPRHNDRGLTSLRAAVRWHRWFEGKGLSTARASPPGPLSISYGHVGCLKARAFPPPV